MKWLMMRDPLRIGSGAERDAPAVHVGTASTQAQSMELEGAEGV